jgi:alpha-tubulin suppressor-like RCC1 family protein
MPEAGGDATMPEAGADSSTPEGGPDATIPVQLTQIAAGYEHTCAVTSTGGVQCWGDGTSGDTGPNSFTQGTPAAVTGLSASAKAVATGKYFSCALLVTGNVECWGDNSQGQLGTGTAASTSSTPVAIAGLASGITQITTGQDFACAVASGQTVQCWGNGASGQLGNGTTASNPTPQTVSSLSGVTAIAAGDTHVCAVSGGGLWCWGNNSSHQLGSATPPTSSTPLNVAGLSGVTGIAAGNDQSCAVTTGGVSCWGGDGFGDTGNPASATPAAVAGLSGALAVAAGGNSSCAITAGNGVMCWGDGQSCELGNGTCLGSQTPVQVTGLTSGVLSIAVSLTHSCALLSDGGASCWGGDDIGQLGNGATTSGTASPTAVSALSGATALAAGQSHACAAEGDGGVVCWGDNNYGDLGNGTGTLSSSPVAVTGLSGVNALSAGVGFSCALTSTGSVECWGSNNEGQLGDATQTDRSTPVPVQGLPGSAAVIASGGFTQYALMQGTGTVYSWGLASSGQLGNGSTAMLNTVTPTLVSLGSAATTIAAGNSFACAVTQGATQVYCWGQNNAAQLGQAGATTPSTSATPLGVSGLTGPPVQAIAAGSEHACVLEGGSVQCWGANTSGQLGDGTMNPRTTPSTPINGSPAAVAIATGVYSTCAAMADGSVECWGNTFGPTPAPVPGLTAIASVSAGGFFECALAKSGGVLCLGSDAEGQLGDGKPTGATPVSVLEP